MRGKRREPERPLVAHVITKLAVGGAQRTALDICEGLAGGRWDLALLAGPDVDAEGSLAEEASRRGVRVISVPHLVRRVRPGRDLFAALWLFRWCRRHRPAIVHTHSSKAGVLGRLAAWTAGVPAIVHSVHGWSFNGDMGPSARRGCTYLERVLARVTTRLVVVTSIDLRKGLEACVGRRDQYEVVYNGIDLADFAPATSERGAVRAGLGVAGSAPLLGTVGRMADPKDPLSMVDAFARVVQSEPRAMFVWVGDGPLRAAVEDRVRERGLVGRFLIPGVRTDVAALLSALDVFVLSSRWEGLPRTVTEAMACGIPVVATDVGGVVEVIEDRRTGLLVPPGDPALLADRVQKLLHQPELAGALARAGRVRARDFDRSAMLGRFDGLYRDLCPDRPSPTELRVSHVITGLGMGGAERTLERLVLATGDLHHEVISLGGDGPVGDRLRQAGVGVHAAGLRANVPGPKGLIRLRRLLRASSPDVVQTWLYHGDLIGGLAARSLGVPVVWNVRQQGFDPATTRPRTRLVAKACARSSRWIPSVVVTNSESGRQGHVGAGYDASRFRVIVNGIDTRRFRPDRLARREVRSELGIGGGDPVVGMIAAVGMAKDHETLLRAVARLRLSMPALRAVLVGTGVDDDAGVGKVVDQLGLADVVVRLGPRHDVERILAALDVAVLSSRGEGWPNAVAEAMACGLPVIATDVGDSRVLVADGGKITAPGDVAALAAAVMDVLAFDARSRADLGGRGRRRIVESYSLAAMCDHYRATWADVAKWT